MSFLEGEAEIEETSSIVVTLGALHPLYAKAVPIKCWDYDRMHHMSIVCVG